MVHVLSTYTHIRIRSDGPMDLVDSHCGHITILCVCEVCGHGLRISVGQIAILGVSGWFGDASYHYTRAEAEENTSQTLNQYFPNDHHQFPGFRQVPMSGGDRIVTYHNS